MNRYKLKDIEKNIDLLKVEKEEYYYYSFFLVMKIKTNVFMFHTPQKRVKKDVKEVSLNLPVSAHILREKAGKKHLKVYAHIGNARTKKELAELVLQFIAKY